MDALNLFLPSCDSNGIEPLAAPQIASALASGISFILETTLSGEYPKSLCRKAKAAGYLICLYYVGLNTPGGIRRIQNRAARGGRSTPEKAMEAGFHRFACDFFVEDPHFAQTGRINFV